MIQPVKRSAWMALCILVDAMLIGLSYIAAVWLRLYVFHGTDNSDMQSLRILLLFFMYGLLVSGLLALMRIHDFSDNRKEEEAFSKIFFVNTVGVVCIVATLFIFHKNDFSRMAISMFWFISTVLLEVSFYSEQKIISSNWEKIVDKKKVIVVGNGDGARRYIETVNHMKYPLISVEGYVGYEKEGFGEPLGNYENLYDVLENQSVDELVIALEPHETDYMYKVLDAAEKEGIGIQMIPLFNEFFPSHPSLETLGDVTLVNLRSTPLDNMWNAFLKRAVDLIGSACLIVVASPIMLIAAIGVYFSSPGPVLFTQERVGKNKVPFKMYKFRSMKVNSEETTGWSTGADPRRTKFGSFIRKYSIDELPQLFNVFKGDMSLVGPRPEIPFYVRKFKETVPLYLVRQQIKPGMTGWAQIHGLRGDTSIEARVKYDIWYIENWSFLLDIKILIRTVFGGFINDEN
ncbi:MAG: undecaprenyl-phosphate glucose phosphotransferase, partial [Oscillospiraceae bacterium]|nr:undecaprenyl-phosphate glucose phosphotransferase [Oscillospiraceae bacterium]